MDQPALPVALAVSTVAITLYSWHRSSRSVPRPPGPRGHWLFGNALEIAKADAFWLQFAEYSNQYGSIISVRLPHATPIIISDPHLVAELFEKRAANYSDKDEIEMMKLTDWDTDILFLHYAYEVQKLMMRLIEQPSEFMQHIRLLAASIAVRITYGYKVASYDDPLVQTAEKHMEGFSDLTQAWNWSVNIFPALRYLPNFPSLIPFQRRAAEVKQIMKDHREKPFKYVQDQIAAGTAEASFTAKLLQTPDGNPVDDVTSEHVKRIAATFYAAGSDTTVSAVQSFFLAMTLYPEIQAKAQSEVLSFLKQRSTTGVSHDMILPADRSSLPYTSALVRELLRWHPIVPIVAHRSNEEDNNVVSKGNTYRIPARTVVLANVWQFLHDPDVYENPERFMPERFLTTNPPPDSETYSFGFGRRSCPGIHIAQQSMWTSISNILANFTVTKAKDENGVEITPKELYTNGIVSHPEPFVCSITPRDGCKEWLQALKE